MKTPFKAKSKRRRRHEARQRAQWIDRYSEQIRLTLIGGGIIGLAFMAAKLVVR